jgi:dihydrofolate reductase
MNNNKKVMRKLKLQVEISVDGCIAGPNNEMDWLICNDDCMKYIDDIAESVDTILMGRKMVDDFISHWSSRMNKLDDPWNAFAKKMVETPKIVFTKTLTKSNWINTEIAKGDLKRRNYQVKEPRWEGHTCLWGCLVRFFLD